MQKVRTLADLNKHNQAQGTATARKLDSLLANGELAKLFAANIALTAKSGAFFGNSPPSILNLAEEAERQIGPQKGIFARRHNAKRSRTDVLRIGPIMELMGISYRLQRSMSGFYQEHARDSPRTPCKKSWSNLKNVLASIADDGVVTRLDPSCKCGELYLRSERYAFKISRKSYEISLGQFEKYFTEGRKPLVLVR